MSQTEKACLIVGVIMAFIGTPLTLMAIYSGVLYLYGDYTLMYRMYESGMHLVCYAVAGLCGLILGLGTYLDG